MIATAALHLGRRVARAWPRFVNGPPWLVLGIGFAVHWSTTVGTVLRWLTPDGISGAFLVNPILGLAIIAPMWALPALLLLWALISCAAVIWWYVTTAHIEVVLGQAGYGLERAAQSSTWARTIINIPPGRGGSPFWYQGTPWAFRLAIGWGLWATTAIIALAWTTQVALLDYPTSASASVILWWLLRLLAWPTATLLLIRSTWAWRDELLARGSAL